VIQIHPKQIQFQLVIIQLRTDSFSNIIVSFEKKNLLFIGQLKLLYDMETFCFVEVKRKFTIGLVQVCTHKFKTHFVSVTWKFMMMHLRHMFGLTMNLIESWCKITLGQNLYFNISYLLKLFQKQIFVLILT